MSLILDDDAGPVADFIDGLRVPYPTNRQIKAMVDESNARRADYATLHGPDRFWMGRMLADVSLARRSGRRTEDRDFILEDLLRAGIVDAQDRMATSVDLEQSMQYSSACTALLHDHVEILELQVLLSKPSPLVS